MEFSNNLNIEKLLLDLGLDDRETKIYLALLNGGPMLPQHIARATGLKRSNLYNIFPEMMKRGLLHEIKQGKRNLLSANSPDKLFDDYEQKYKEIRQNISELAALYRVQGFKPRIEVYEGLEGIQKVYMDTIDQKKEVLSVDRIANYHPSAYEWVIKHYISERVKRNVWIRAIVTANEAAKIGMPDTEEECRKTRFVPEAKFPFKIDTMIYGDKICFTMCEKGKPLVGIIIQSKEIAQTQRALFDLAWEGAEKYSV